MPGPVQLSGLGVGPPAAPRPFCSRDPWGQEGPGSPSGLGTLPRLWCSQHLGHHLAFRQWEQVKVVPPRWPVLPECSPGSSSGSHRCRAKTSLSSWPCHLHWPHPDRPTTTLPAGQIPSQRCLRCSLCPKHLLLTCSSESGGLARKFSSSITSSTMHPRQRPELAGVCAPSRTWQLFSPSTRLACSAHPFASRPSPTVPPHHQHVWVPSPLCPGQGFHL